MKKKFLLFFLLLFLNHLVFCLNNNIKNVPGLNDEIYNKLSGVWNTNVDYKTILRKFSWGYSKYTVNTSFVIDFGKKDVDSGTGFGSLNIVSIEKMKNNVFKLNLTVPEGFEVFITIKYLKDDTISVYDQNGMIDNGTYYKIGGPNIKILLTPTIDNLRFRETPDLNGKYIRSLKQGEKLELIEKGKTETINGTKGTWLKVKTEKGEIGWCFDAYLKEVKKK
jgi:hypothetical protein